MVVYVPPPPPTGGPNVLLVKTKNNTSRNIGNEVLTEKQYERKRIKS